MNGVWVAYIWDHGFNIMAVFGEEIDALRYVASENVGYSVTFLAYGTTCRTLEK